MCVAESSNKSYISSNSPFSSLKMPKIDFSVFDGTNARSWILKAHNFFSVSSCGRTSEGVIGIITSKSSAEHWYQSFGDKFSQSSWSEFTETVNARFSDKVFENIVGEFNRLRQQTTVLEYQAKFEELQPLVLRKYSGLSEDYFVASFISGLREELQHTVGVFQSSTLHHAISLARLQETKS